VNPDPARLLAAAQALTQRGDHAGAEAVLRPVMDRDEALPALAAALRNQGKLSQAAQAMAGLARRQPADLETTLGRLRFVNGCQRQTLAAELCALELDRHPQQAAVHEFAGRMALVLGRFERARAHYLEALRLGSNLDLTFVLHALSGCQRYRDPAHPDLELFHRHLEDPGLSDLARASILFALGKAQDDLGDFAAAAASLRRGNALVRGTLDWSREAWNAEMERLASRKLPVVQPADDSFVPVFVVGMPRSGTTLVADRLGRHPQLRNRGELNLVPYLERWVSGSGQPQNPRLLAEVARFAKAQMVQDDAPARWYLDKNPLNFRYVGLIAALLPQARFIWCRRDPRDTALSVWSQFFARGEDNGYAYDFADIAAASASCERLMRHWQAQPGIAVCTVDYERLVAEPDAGFRALGDFLGLPGFDPGSAGGEAQVITTSSAWQARQPVYKSSSGRWTAYASYLPELGSLF
jgi:tetratricopeptide (TPR) repeat protein